jgi:NAD(P)-dependent dehydrogenase (short-subunit alcohol dehydrogenase family)
LEGLWRSGFAKEGACVVIPYYNEHKDAEETKAFIESMGGTCVLMAGDIKDTAFCDKIVDETTKKFGRIDVLVNNAGVQYQQKNLLDITDEQFDNTMKTNIYSIFYLTKRALKCMNPRFKYNKRIINNNVLW